MLIRERGPNWDHSRRMREQDAWDAHAEFMEGLADEGFIFLGGPLGDDLVMHVVVAGSPEEIVERLAADPWEPMGLLRNVSIERWHVLLGDPPRLPCGVTHIRGRPGFDVVGSPAELRSRSPVGLVNPPENASANHDLALAA